ncbi:hypothetical protein BC834DRAFT_81688 [Gloeopeniophorella convolvens]|nr:hypothetical protein BC834DRAFT_81688 [Gloeopeniophorella convolvens]
MIQSPLQMHISLPSSRRADVEGTVPINPPACARERVVATLRILRTVLNCRPSQASARRIRRVATSLRYVFPVPVGGASCASMWVHTNARTSGSRRGISRRRDRAHQCIGAGDHPGSPRILELQLSTAKSRSIVAVHIRAHWGWWCQVGHAVLGQRQLGHSLIQDLTIVLEPCCQGHNLSLDSSIVGMQRRLLMAPWDSGGCVWLARTLRVTGASQGLR